MRVIAENDALIVFPKMTQTGYAHLAECGYACAALHGRRKGRGRQCLYPTAESRVEIFIDWCQLLPPHLGIRESPLFCYVLQMWDDSLP